MKKRCASDVLLALYEPSRRACSFTPNTCSACPPHRTRTRKRSPGSYIVFWICERCNDRLAGLRRSTGFLDISKDSPRHASGSTGVMGIRTEAIGEESSAGLMRVHEGCLYC